MFLQKAVVSYSSTVLIQIITLVASIIVARIVGPEILGTVAFGLSFAKMLQFLTKMGANTANIKLISQGEKIEECIGTYTRIKIILSIFYLITIIAFVLIQKHIFNYTFESKAHEYVIYISALIIAVQELSSIAFSTFKAKTELAKSNLPLILRTILNQSFRLIVAFLGYKALALALSNLAATILVVPLYIYFFRNYKIGKFNKQIAGKYKKIMIPLIFMTVATSIFASADKVFLQYLTNSKEVGFYFAGFRFGNLIQTLGGSIAILFFPMFSQEISKNNREIINTYFIKFHRFLFIFLFPFVTILVICSDLIVDVTLGKEYYQSISIISIVTLSFFLDTYSRPFSSLLNGLGLFKLQSILNIIKAALFILIVFILVNPTLLNMKSEGMAYSLLASNIIFCALIMIYAKINFKELKLFSTLYIIIFSIVYMTIGIISYQYIKDLIIPKLVFILVYLTLFWISGILLKIFKKKDWDMFEKIFHIKKLFSYIKLEIKKNK